MSLSAISKQEYVLTQKKWDWYKEMVKKDI
jgi:hypothetical protein